MPNPTTTHSIYLLLNQQSEQFMLAIRRRKKNCFLNVVGPLINQKFLCKPSYYSPPKIYSDLSVTIRCDVIRYDIMIWYDIILYHTASRVAYYIYIIWYLLYTYYTYIYMYIHVLHIYIYIYYIAYTIWYDMIWYILIIIIIILLYYILRRATRREAGDRAPNKSRLHNCMLVPRLRAIVT